MTPIYYLRISAGQGTAYLDGSSTLSLTKLRPSCRGDCILIWRLNWERNPFQAHSHSWQNSFPWGFMTKDPSFFLAIGQRLPTVPHHVGCLLLQTSKIRLQDESSTKTEPFIVNRIIGGTSHYFHYVLLVRSKSRVLPTLKSKHQEAGLVGATIESVSHIK